MEDRVRKQIEDILEAKDREALLALYTEARNIGDWNQAHDRLLDLTVLLLERSTKIIKDMGQQQEEAAKQIKAIEKRLATLIKTA